MIQMIPFIGDIYLLQICEMMNKLASVQIKFNKLESKYII